MEIKFLVLCLFAMATLASRGPHGRMLRSDSFVSDQQNPVVITNPREPRYGNINFALEADLTIGREGDPNYSFFKVRDIEADSQGNIYVLDSGDCRIQKYDRGGKYVATIGRKGQGPGEFGLPLGLQIDDESGNIYVNDNARKIIIFDKAGKYETDVVVDGNLLSFILGPDRSLWGKFFWGSNRYIKRVDAWDNNGQKLAEVSFETTVVLVEEKRTSQNTGFGTYLQMFHGYERDLYLAKLDKRRFIYADSMDYVLNFVQDDGKVVQRASKPEAARDFSKEDVAEIERSMKMAALRGGTRVDRVSPKLPEHIPFIYAIFADSHGRIYVQRNARGERDESIRMFDIFSRDGRYLYRARIPAQPYRIREGFLYSVLADKETGEESVKKYSIRNWGQIKDSPI